MDHQPLEDTWKVMREHRLKLVDDTSSEYLCILCENILINASTAPCGCRFCVDCIKEYLQEGKRKCPGQSQLCDVEEVDFDNDIQINRLINKKISKLSVRCPNLGCQSQVDLNMIGDHLRICENQPEICPYLLLGCDNEKLRKDIMKDHLFMDIYPHSTLLMNWIRQSQNEMKVLRIDIDKLRTDNEELKNSIRVDREETKKIVESLEKIKGDNSREIELLNDEMCGLTNKMKKEKLKKLKDNSTEQIVQLEAKIKHQNQEIDQLKTEIQNQSQEIVTLKENYQLIKSKCDDVHQHQEKSNEKLNEITELISVESMEMKKSIETMQIIINQINYGDFVWEIENYSQKVSTARHEQPKWIFSDPFFTHKNGYQILLSAWIGKKYVEIDFYIMKGCFDENLQWPFDRDLELSLINQNTGLKPNSEKNDRAFWFSFSLSPEEILSNADVCQEDKILIKFCSKATNNPK